MDIVPLMNDPSEIQNIEDINEENINLIIMNQLIQMNSVFKSSKFNNRILSCSNEIIKLRSFNSTNCKFYLKIGLSTLKCHENIISSIKITKDQNILTSSYDKTVKIIDLIKQETLDISKNHSSKFKLKKIMFIKLSMMGYPQQ
jgi:WD40 repeat protein